MRFCRAGGRPWAVLSVYAIVAVALLAHAYFTYLAPSVDGRLVVYSATRTVLLACCALEPLRSHAARRSLSYWVLVTLIPAVSAHELHHVWPALQPGHSVDRSEESRVGKGWIIQCSSRWSPYLYNKT